jgi:hypothetical protein
MKLAQIALIAVLSAGFLGPAFAKGAGESAEAEALQAEAMQAGATHEQHMTYWNTMKPERQDAWKTHCAAAASDPAVAQAETAERKAFCQSISH